MCMKRKCRSSIYISQSSPEKKREREREREKRRWGERENEWMSEWIGTGLHGYEGREVLWSSVCRDNQSWWYSSAWVQRSENQGWYLVMLLPVWRPEKHWCKSWSPQAQEPGVWMPRVGENGCPSSKREREWFPLPLSFCSIGPSTDWMIPTHTGGGRSSLFSVLNQILVLPEIASWIQPEIMFY